MNGPVIVTEHIRDLTIEEIAQLSAPELACLLDDLAAQKASLRQIEDKLDAALDRRYGARAKQCRAEAGKDTGTVRFVDNDFTVIADLPKRVKWDQAKLRHAVEIIRTGWGDDPADYVKTKLEVSEAAFTNWPRPVRELFIPARTVETGRPVYRIEAHRFGPARGRMNTAGRPVPQGRAGSSFGARSTPRRPLREFCSWRSKMPVRIITADERLSAAQNKTSIGDLRTSQVAVRRHC